MRAAQQAEQADLMTILAALFSTNCYRSSSRLCTEAIQMGYLRNTDTFVMHANEVLYAALAKIKAMHAANYLPPLQKQFKVAGIEGHAEFKQV